jgi:predicted transcriptional regulator with HTH domain
MSTTTTIRRRRGLKEFLCILSGLLVRWIIVTSRRRRHSQSTTTSSISISHHHSDGGGRTKLIFLFFMGLEGTGHHLITRVIEQSPIFDKIVELDIHTLYTSQLQGSLYNQATQKGLWNAHCFQPKPNGTSSSNAVVDVSSKEQRVIDIVRKIRQRVAAHRPATTTTKTDRRIVVPLNALDTRFRLSYGMVSYPSFVGHCRPLAYPNMDLWYELCYQLQHEAHEKEDDYGIDTECNVVYLYRDPARIVRSTARRKFYKTTVLPAIHLYKSHLSIIAAQIIANPQKIKGCYNLLSTNSTDQSTWQDSLHVVLGWSENRTGFDDVINSICKPKSSWNSSSTSAKATTSIADRPTDDDDDVIPRQYQPYLDSLIRANEHVTHLCHQAMKVSQST